jgi:hypothetical protein
MARYKSDGSNALFAGVSRNPSTRRASVRLDRRNPKENAIAEQNATTGRAGNFAPIAREVTMAEVSAANPLARNAAP